MPLGCEPHVGTDVLVVGTDMRVDAIRRGALKNKGIMFVPKSSHGGTIVSSRCSPVYRGFAGRREAASTTRGDGVPSNALR